jgi:hypothetical protein
MLQARICVLVALLVGTTFIATAEDYVNPTGVTVLTEEQLLKQIIGNTLMGGNGQWFNYFLPPSGDQKKGRFRYKSASSSGPSSGDWTIHGALMCKHYDKTTLVAFNGCYTTALDGDIVTWYETDGSPWYNRFRTLKLISGYPENF